MKALAVRGKIRSSAALMVMQVQVRSADGSQRGFAN
jgi:hypothetical protein